MQRLSQRPAPGSPWLICMVVLQLLTLASQWVSSPTGGAPVAMAQIPDAGAQRYEIIDQLKSINQKLDALTGVLQSGKLQVRTTPSDSK